MLVQDFTRRILTYESDKLTAPSGIARAYGQNRSDFYINGIWTGDLDLGIMWQAEARGYRNTGRTTTIAHIRGAVTSREDTFEPRITVGQRGVGIERDGDQEAGRPTQRTAVSATLAPSWSWVSVDGPVVWKHGAHESGISLLTNVQLDPSPVESRFSSVDCAILFRAKVQHIEYDFETGKFNASREYGQRQELNDVALEALPDIDMPCFLVWARAMPAEEGYYHLGSLLVQSTTVDAVSYRRIGVFWIHSKGAGMIFPTPNPRDIRLLSWNSVALRNSAILTSSRFGCQTASGHN
jgi:hypothetical protein